MSTQVRDYADADRDYVIACWLSNFWPHAPNRDRVSKREFDADLDAKIKASLTNGMRVLVAYDSDFPRVIIGWIAFGPGLALHYVYVGRAYRRQGVASHLATNAGGWSFRQFTHRTPDLTHIRGYGLADHRPDLFPVGPRDV